MKKNTYKHILALLSCVLLTQVVFAQNKSGDQESSFPDYQSKWIYFNLTDTVEMKVIEHSVAGFGCGTFAAASITTGITGSDTIRVLELCNTNKEFKNGQMVNVIPGNKPNFHVSLPVGFYLDADGKMQPDKLDVYVLKTTYGTIVGK